MKKYIEYITVATGDTYTIQYEDNSNPIIASGVWNDNGVWIDEEIMFNE